MSRPLRFNARQVHLCCALWAIRALMGVLSSVYSVNVIFRFGVLCGSEKGSPYFELVFIQRLKPRARERK